AAKSVRGRATHPWLFPLSARRDWHGRPAPSACGLGERIPPGLSEPSRPRPTLCWPAFWLDAAPRRRATTRGNDRLDPPPALGPAPAAARSPERLPWPARYRHRGPLAPGSAAGQTPATMLRR